MLQGIYEVEDKAFAGQMEFLIESLELDEFLSSPVRTLSLGQRMRADFAAALLHMPDVLFLDEPTIGVDAVVKDKIREVIKKVNAEQGVTIVLTTHDMGDIENLSSRLLIIDKGSIAYDGTIEEIKEKYGFARKVSIEVADPYSFSGSDFNSLLEISEEFLEASFESPTLRLSFNKNEVDTSKLISKAASAIPFKDIKIAEADISEIVKLVYRNGAKGFENQ
jgi:ABC-2 type transport system ATP-binding protein